jgi:hypothetical protein
MSGADHRRPTLRLDPKQLEELVKDAAAAPEPEAEPALARCNTLEDPLTTQLLAEVTRRTQTMDLDDLAHAADDETTNLAPPAEPSHPHTRRRPR